ncbi:MAG: glycoside-pentoside-hexuronide (GPH):cation symporter [Treponema sp.]|jgi:GPH family glycoside/pentoside/hexuronide:cation symporter|nr:glycoside-pentoside-hexuronide (GPH):cation symporter [Treponema sp.]
MSTAAQASSNAIRPFGMRDKLAYALGDFGCNCSFALNGYLMLFYTQYIGLSLEVWGIIILVLKIWDGINDPIMGGLMDSLKPGKRGKFRTYIFYGSFVLAVSGALCFLPIPDAPMGVKIFVCLTGYLVWDMAYTVVNVPYGAMNAVISSKPSDRAQLSTFRTLGAMTSAIVVMIILPVFCYDRENNLLGSRIFVIALILGAAGFLAFQLMLKGVKERVVIPEDAKAHEKYNYLLALKNFFKNRAAVGITLAAMVQLLMTFGISSANQILFQSFFRNARISGIAGFISMIPMFVFIPLIKPVVNKFGKREAAAIPLLLGILSSLLMAILPVTPDAGGLVLWIILCLLTSLSTVIFSMVGWAMVADCIDYQEQQTGKREEGTVYATYSLGRKLAQGFGSSIIAFLLILTGYNSALGAQQSMDTANNVRILIGLTQFVCLLFLFILLRFVYNLGKKKVEEMESSLGRSRGSYANMPAEE